MATAFPSTEDLRLHLDSNEEEESACIDKEAVASFPNLPFELMGQIFKNLSVADRGRAAQVCRSWRNAIYSPDLWRNYVYCVKDKKKKKWPLPAVFDYVAMHGIRQISLGRQAVKGHNLKLLMQSIPELRSLTMGTETGPVEDAALIHAFGHCERPNLTKLCLSGNSRLVGDGEEAEESNFAEDYMGCVIIGHRNITDIGMFSVVKSARNLVVLGLGSCTQLTDKTLMNIFRFLPKLQLLDLNNCSVTDVGIGYLIGLNSAVGSSSNPDKLCGGLQNLRSLILRGTMVTDLAVKHLKSMASLKHLDLTSCDDITDTSMAYLTEGPCQLESLELGFHNSLSADGMRHLAKVATLRSLSFQRSGMSDKWLEILTKGVPLLEYINLNGCVMITEVGLKYLDRLVHLKTIEDDECGPNYSSDSWEEDFYNYGNDFGGYDDYDGYDGYEFEDEHQLYQNYYLHSDDYDFEW